jgi:hypothetical protein
VGVNYGSNTRKFLKICIVLFSTKMSSWFGLVSAGRGDDQEGAERVDQQAQELRTLLQLQKSGLQMTHAQKTPVYVHRTT